jgi:hypothetical protein
VSTNRTFTDKALFSRSNGTAPDKSIFFLSINPKPQDRSSMLTMVRGNANIFPINKFFNRQRCLSLIETDFCTYFIYMDLKEIKKSLKEIIKTPDLLEKGLKTAAVVTALFNDEGVALVVVGGAAVEFYTQGAYMSGDIDLCRKNIKPVPLRTCQKIMGNLGATGGPRSWFVAGLFVDILGFLENEARSPLRTIATPLGNVQVVPPELLLVERVLTAVYPQPNREELNCARKLMAACVCGKVPVDWDEIGRLADSPSYKVYQDLIKMKKEIFNEINGKTHKS